MSGRVAGEPGALLPVFGVYDRLDEELRRRPADLADDSLQEQVALGIHLKCDF